MKQRPRRSSRSSRVAWTGIAAVLHLLIALPAPIRGAQPPAGQPSGRAPGAGGPQPTVDEIREPLANAYRQLLPLVGVDKPGAADMSAAQLLERMERAFAEVEASERTLPRDTFDVDAIVRQVGPDREKLFTWVRDHTSLAPYRGVLRGPVGVLMDRLGNSLDRALLLAALLTASGATVRLAHATLSREQADSIAAVVPHPEGGAPPAAGDESIDRFARTHGLDAASIRRGLEQVSEASRVMVSRFQQLATSQAAGIQAVLGQRPSGGERGAAQALEAMRDHWWVQVQDTSGWLDLDPTRPEAVAGSVIATATEVMPPAELPARLHHQVVIRVIVERWKAGALEQSTALERAIRPMEAIGQRIVLRHQPLDGPRDLHEEGNQAMPRLKASLLAQTHWVPVLTVGNATRTRSSFDDSGEVYADPRDRARKGTEKAAPAGGILDAFGGDDAPAPPASRLTAEWIEFEVRVHGEAPSRSRRDVFDLIGPAARVTSQVQEPVIDEASRTRRALALIEETDVLPLVCRLSPEFVQHVLNTGLLNQREALLGLLRATPQEDRGRSMQRASKVDLSSGPLYGLAVVRHAWSPVSNDVFMDRANLITYRRGLQLDAAHGLLVRQRFDIVANHVGVRARADIAPFKVRVLQGVVDTAAENVLVSSACGACRTAENTSELWRVSQAQGVDWVALGDGGGTASVPEGVNADSRARAALERRGGFLVLVPTRPLVLGGRPQIGWWRVHSESGTTLGIMESGEGQATVESISTRLVVGITFGVTYHQCLGSASALSWRSAVCVGCAAVAAYSAGAGWIGYTPPGVPPRLFFAAPWVIGLACGYVGALADALAAAPATPAAPPQ